MKPASISRKTSENICETKLINLVTNSKKKKIRHLYRGINEFQKG
jgi:hypothetical protein